MLSPPSGAYLTRVVHLSNVTLRLEIWDTAGQEKYHSVTPLYYRGAHAALLVYDISKRVKETDTWPWKLLILSYLGWWLCHHVCLCIVTIGNIYQSSGVAQRAWETVHPWIDCHMAGRQQGRSSNTSTSLSGGTKTLSSVKLCLIFRVKFTLWFNLWHVISGFFMSSYRKDRVWPTTGAYSLQRHQHCQGIKSTSCF